MGSPVHAALAAGAAATSAAPPLPQAHPWAAHASGSLMPLLHFFCDLVVAQQHHGAGAAAAATAHDRLLIQVRAPGVADLV